MDSDFRIESKLIVIRVPRMSAHPLFEPNVRCTHPPPVGLFRDATEYHEEYNIMYVLLLSLHSCF